MSGKVHLRSEGMPGHLWRAGRTLCGKEQKPEPDNPTGECKRCFCVWRQVAKQNFQCGA